MPPDSSLKKLSWPPSAENLLRVRTFIESRFRYTRAICNGRGSRRLMVSFGRKAFHSVQTHLSLPIIRSALKRSQPATTENGITVSGAFPRSRFHRKKYQKYSVGSTTRSLSHDILQVTSF
jgi:hypothetical protein